MQNYHEVELWRQLTREAVIATAGETEGTIIVPQTIYSTAHFDEIIGGVRQHVPVEHFTLVATEATIHMRIAERAAKNETTGEWAIAMIATCLAAQRDARYEVHLDAEQQTPTELVAAILDRLPKLGSAR